MTENKKQFYASDRIDNIDDADIPRIAAICDSYNDTMKATNEDMRWLMKMFIEKVRVTHMELDIHCRTCRMKTMSCFLGYVEYWKQIGKI